MCVRTCPPSNTQPCRALLHGVYLHEMLLRTTGILGQAHTHKRLVKWYLASGFAHTACAPCFLYVPQGASPGDDPSAPPAPLTPALLSRISSAAAVPPGSGAAYAPFEGSALVPDLFPGPGDLANLIARTSNTSGRLGNKVGGWG